MTNNCQYPPNALNSLHIYHGMEHFLQKLRDAISFIANTATGNPPNDIANLVIFTHKELTAIEKFVRHNEDYLIQELPEGKTITLGYVLEKATE